MSLSQALMIASQSLGTISSQIGVVSRNISNAGVEGATKKTSLVITGANGGAEFTGIKRATNEALFRKLLTANAANGAGERISNALDQMDLELNLSDTTQNRSLATLISKFSNELQNYSVNPDNQTTADQAILAAKDIVGGLRSSTIFIQEKRQQADTNIAAAVADINDILDKIAEINHEVVSGSGTGIDIIDSIDRRDSLLMQLSKKIGVSTIVRPNNDLVIYASNGATLLETTPRAVTFLKSNNLSAGLNGSAVYIDGVQSTGTGAPAPLLSGEIAGDIKFRDSIAPTYQNQLDEIARGLIIAIVEKDQIGAGAPLPGLFTTSGATAIPAATLTPGIAGELIINPLVDPAQGGDVKLLRDGGISGNAAYIYNTQGLSGFTDRLLELSDAASVKQNFDSSAQLDTSTTLNGFAAASVGWIGALRQNITRETTYQGAIVSQSTQALSNATGVNLDDQMAHMLTLENAYQVSAKLLQTINTIYDELFAAIAR
jgi:flagellar hook-associated protein 1 FlgK